MPLSAGVSASLFEAMATGNYPIVSDLEGNRSWIRNNENGRLITCDDVNSLSNALEEVWNDKVKWRNAIESNLSLVRHKASYETNMQVIANHYHKMIDEYDA